MKRINIYKAGSNKYYKDALSLISAICTNFDGFNTAKGLKSLVDDVRNLAKSALNKEKLYENFF